MDFANWEFKPLDSKTMVTGTRGKIGQNLSRKNSLGLTGKQPKEGNKKHLQTKHFSTKGHTGVSALLTFFLAVVFPVLAVAPESGKESWHFVGCPRQFVGRPYWQCRCCLDFQLPLCPLLDWRFLNGEMGNRSMVSLMRDGGCLFPVH